MSLGCHGILKVRFYLLAIFIRIINHDFIFCESKLAQVFGGIVRLDKTLKLSHRTEKARAAKSHAQSIR
jgi:hypothetical protein